LEINYLPDIINKDSNENIDNLQNEFFDINAITDPEIYELTNMNNNIDNKTNYYNNKNNFNILSCENLFINNKNVDLTSDNDQLLKCLYRNEDYLKKNNITDILNPNDIFEKIENVKKT
jgi:hypothetical protein